ncbi:MAG: tetratricopeptide repeat protein [Thermoanaerobaculia bacterium]
MSGEDSVRRSFGPPGTSLRVAHRLSLLQSLRTSLRAGGLAIALSGIASAPLAAQSASGPVAGFELTSATQHSLHRLQESWLQWVSSFYRDNPAKAEEALRALNANARQIGMVKLVDFASGATALALQSGREGKFERADWTLAAAEALDPDRPDVAFARATIARQRGSYLSALTATVSGFVRLARSSESVVFSTNLIFWGLAVLLVAAALFVLVEVATKGSAVVADLRSSLARKMPAASATICVALVLLWPLALPSGPVWLLLYWSALLWGYESPSERWVSLAVWLIAGFAPWLAVVQQQRVAVALSPPMRALSNLAEGRIYGGLFADLQVLRAAVGDKPAVLELVGDVHRTLGEWDEARSIYRKVLENEPANVAVLLNLGDYHFRKGDFAIANDYFLQATRAVPSPAAAFYNLSLSYSETYQFEESRRAIARAKEIDADLVDQWVRAASPERVVILNGGLSRHEEIRRLLIDAWGETSASGAPSERHLGGWLSPAGAGVVAVLALVLYFLRRRKGFAEPRPWLAWRSDPFSRWLRALLPALSQAELGEGAKVAFSLTAVALISLLPFLFSTGVVLPLGSGIPVALPWFLFATGLLLYVGLCVRSELGEGE